MRNNLSVKKTRVILSVVLSVLIGMGITTSLVSFVFGFTTSSQTFLKKNFVNDAVVAECDRQIEAAFTVLEAESNIPLRVFMNVKSDHPTSASINEAVECMFNELDPSLYSDKMVDYFYNLCREYLDGNEIKYNKHDVKNVARRAAEIYSNIVGIHNVDYVNMSLPSLNKSCAKISSSALLVCVVFSFLLIIMYSEKSKAVYYIVAGAVGGGIATTLSSVMLIVFRAGSGLSFSPLVYQQSIASMLRLCFVIMAAIGALVVAFGAVTLAILKKSDEKKRRH